MPRTPVPIGRRDATAPFLHDPLDAYDQTLRLWRVRAAVVPRAQWGESLLFVHRDGSPYSSEDVARIAQRVARAAGWPAAAVRTVGAKAFRVGGATDLRDIFGVAVASSLLKRRGRWGSDIGEIYARTSLDEQLLVSTQIGDSQGADLERLCAGWAQPRH
jgi:hypothetical protein